MALWESNGSPSAYREVFRETETGPSWLCMLRGGCDKLKLEFHAGYEDNAFPTRTAHQWIPDWPERLYSLHSWKFSTLNWKKP